jgi:hypothetical protein
VIEVVPMVVTSVYQQIASPTLTGSKNVMLDTATVTTVPLATFVAVISAAASITDMIQPPKMLPIGLMCDGIANIRDAISPGMLAGRFDGEHSLPDRQDRRVGGAELNGVGGGHLSGGRRIQGDWTGAGLGQRSRNRHLGKPTGDHGGDPSDDVG